MTNAKPSAIYRLRPLLPLGAQSSSNIQTPPANLGIEISPLPQLEQLAGAIGTGEDKGKGKEVVRNTDVGMVAEKIVKNVRDHPVFIRRRQHEQLFNYLHSFGGEIKLTYVSDPTPQRFKFSAIV